MCRQAELTEDPRYNLLVSAPTWQVRMRISPSGPYPFIPELTSASRQYEKLTDNKQTNVGLPSHEYTTPVNTM